MLLLLEQLQHEQIEAATSARETKVELSAMEREAALELLRDPQLISRILGD